MKDDRQSDEKIPFLAIFSSELDKNNLIDTRQTDVGGETTDDN